MKRRVLASTLAVLLVALFCAAAIAADEKTISGKINDDNQLVADDGTVYEIATSMKGDELIGETGKKVTVTGTVSEQDGKKTIEVNDFKVME